MPQPKKRTKNASAMRMVGQILANYRRAAGYTQRSLAAQVCADEETIASIEQGRRSLKSDLAEQLDELLGTRGALAVAVQHLPEMDRYPLWGEEFLDRERQAVAISSFENQVIPGLLQTESYARAVFDSKVPPSRPDEKEERVTERLKRQEILRRQVPPTVSFVIAQAVFMDRIGGNGVWREQVQHLCEAADLPGLSLQIMPFGRETHAALDGPFVLLETPDLEHLGYMETQRGSMLVSDGTEVGILARKYAMLRTQALNVEDSKDLLTQLLGGA
ncbi:Scr1 family TA system antitoxin-like transcriptional regulator [Streptomyces sp. NPDC053499]|uniref:helix-turn-helix domain-containing protein n=1 Tax=Streptomyces sp. NPDC053499 TaxID=3365707 RepID=UPI0037D06AF4